MKGAVSLHLPGNGIIEKAKRLIPDPLYLQWKFRRKLGY
jgi:hypothetical protein